MPFGAELIPDRPSEAGLTTGGQVCFRLWAPAAEGVAVEIARPRADFSSHDADLIALNAGLHGPSPPLPAHASRDDQDDQDNPPLMLDLKRAGDGWFSLTTAAAGPGSRYRYLIIGPPWDGVQQVPDPAARFQPGSVHGFSEVIDPAAFAWGVRGPGADWHGRAWETAVLYELHVGTFSPEGTFAGAAKRLPDLAALGITAVELMPVAAFPGRRNWGYDGVLPFAPAPCYGRPEDLKAFIEQAHALGLMVLLDVVYNHFGPEGNYLHLYAPAFFTQRHQTPWGAGINFDGPDSALVRDFFIHNALYWLNEYRFDGLRLDAVHAIADDSDPDILSAIAAAVAAGPGQEREVHLVLENGANQSRYLTRNIAGRARRYTAQWNDDFHHAAHVLLTGERDGYYADFARAPARQLARCLAEGFAFQGEPSAFRGGARRGEPSRGLPPLAFVNLLQNHDQIGNRAFGERLHRLTKPAALRAATCALLLAPSPPLLFMGQEFAADSPFLFFCDFGPDLAASVTRGRRHELARLAQFADEAARAAIPDPNHPESFARSRLDWSALGRGDHRDWLDFHRRLLALRHAEIIPRLRGITGRAGRFTLFGVTGLLVRWRLGDGSTLHLAANLGDSALADPALAAALAPLTTRSRLHIEPGDAAPALAAGRLPPWTVVWHLLGGGTAEAV